MPNQSRIIDALYYRLRRHVLARDALCARCGERPSEEMDHIVPLAKGGKDEDGNLQGLCKACHREKSLEDFAPEKLVDRDGNVDEGAMRRCMARVERMRRGARGRVKRREYGGRRG